MTSTFYTNYVLFAFFEMLVFSTGSVFTCLAWSQARTKGLDGWRPWLAPSAVGSVVAALLTVLIFLRTWLRVRPTVETYYFDWTVQIFLGFVSVYAVVRMWLMVQYAQAQPRLTSVDGNPTHGTDIWPPPPANP